jgi:hypothetical protein
MATSVRIAVEAFGETLFPAALTINESASIDELLKLSPKDEQATNCYGGGLSAPVLVFESRGQDQNAQEPPASQDRLVGIITAFDVL